MIVAIDGTAGSGKSTIADMVARKFDFVNINSGNLYRAITSYVISKEFDVKDQKAVEKLLGKIKIEYVDYSTVKIDNVEFRSEDLHTQQIDSNISAISSYQSVRDNVNKELNRFAKGKNVVCEGRDITSVVFPKADVKVFVDADVRTRAYRRAMQYGRSRDEVISDMIKRDKEDQNREVGALRLVEGALKLDTTSITEEEAYHQVALLIREKQKEKK